MFGDGKFPCDGRNWSSVYFILFIFWVVSHIKQLLRVNQYLSALTVCWTISEFLLWVCRKCFAWKKEKMRNRLTSD